MAPSRIKGYASINTGIVPEVRVTIADESRTREIPDDKIIKPVWSFSFFRATKYNIRHTTASIKGYKSSMPRVIVPLAFPSRSKCAGSNSGNELHFTPMAKTVATIIKIGINHPFLFISKININYSSLITCWSCSKKYAPSPPSICTW